MREQWAADLEAVTDYGMSPHRYAIGLLLAAARLRALSSRRPRIVAIGASLALLITGGSIVYISTSRPVCTTSQQVLGVVAGDTFYANSQPDRVIAAMRAI